MASVDEGWGLGTQENFVQGITWTSWESTLYSVIKDWYENLSPCWEGRKQDNDKLKTSQRKSRKEAKTPGACQAGRQYTGAGGRIQSLMAKGWQTRAHVDSASHNYIAKDSPYRLWYNHQENCLDRTALLDEAYLGPVVLTLKSQSTSPLFLHFNINTSKSVFTQSTGLYSKKLGWLTGTEAVPDKNWHAAVGIHAWHTGV